MKNHNEKIAMEFEISKGQLKALRQSADLIYQMQSIERAYGNPAAARELYRAFTYIQKITNNSVAVFHHKE